ncbi:MAG: PKD domain-containing protein, partial [Chitinophagales bacterium]
DMYVVRIDSNGEQLGFAHYGGAGDENANAVIRTSDGGYAFLGYSTSVDPSYDIYLVKTDSDLNFLWSRDFGGVYEDIGNDLAEDSMGNLWLLGFETVSPDSSYMVLIKTDADGNNAVTFHPGTHAGDLGNSIRRAKGGGFLITGVTNVTGKGSEMLLERLDSNGDTLWTRHFGGTQSEFGFSVASDDSGNIFIAGETEGFGTNQFDAYLVKTDSTGDIPCPPAVSFTSSSNEICEDENVFFTNTTISSQNFLWNVDGNNFSNNVDAGYYFSQPGNYSIALAACNASSSQQIIVNPKPATHFTYAIYGDEVLFTLDQGLNVQSISWNFGDGSSIDTSNQNPVHIYSSTGLYWVVVSVTNQFGCDSTFAAQLEIVTAVEDINSETITIFPNPSATDILIRSTLLTEVKKILIMNVAGYVQKIIIPAGEETRFSVNDLAPGIYFLKFEMIGGDSYRRNIEVY